MLRSRVWLIVAAALIVLALLVVIGNAAVVRTNPPVTYTITWDSPETEALARAACFDCHSHETRWPWYAHIAPAAFLIVQDVNEGRKAMNFSTGHKLEGDEMVEQIESGRMPKPIYLPLHPEANLSAEQKSRLMAGLLATFGQEKDERGWQEEDEPEDEDED